MVEIFSAPVSDQLVLILNASIAAILGSIIGWERDRAGKSAGPRTMALVGTAAVVVVGVGHILNIDAAFGDPTRSMHAVITGIGFLGAGLIFQQADRGAQGVATAATVFATAAMGCAVGLGFQIVGAGLTVIVLIVLRSSHAVEYSTKFRDRE
jgi:putative Mg2+ transporter-C (MgtC) family protein